MTTAASPQRTDLDSAIRALKQDLVGPDGPRISTTRNYNFAILPYLPQEELALRKRIKTMTEELRAEGWSVLSLALHRLLLDRLRRLDPGHLESTIARERRLHTKDPERSLTFLTEFLSHHIEGPDGLAADVANAITEFKARLPRLTHLPSPSSGARGPLPVLPHVRPAAPHRRAHRRRARRAALSRRAPRPVRPVVHGRADAGP